MTSNPNPNTSDADRTTNRIADLTLVAAHHHPGCPTPAAARDLLTDHVGPEAAEHLIAEARAVWRDPANPAEDAMTAEDETLFRAEQGS